MPIARHFTSTAFVVNNGYLALHWHAKVQTWLPPGGHLEENEDPVQAVLREVEEETGLTVEIVPTGSQFDLEYPSQVIPPFTIMVEDIYDSDKGHHQHIDMIYICCPTSPANPTELNEGWLWVSRDSLTEGIPLKRNNGLEATPPGDVVELAKFAFQVVDDLSNKSA